MVRDGVVVTGIGVVTPVGRTVDEMFEAMCSGRSGLRRPPENHPLHGVLDVAGIADPIDATTVLPAAQARTVDRYVVLAMAAAADALAGAGLRVGVDVDPYRMACIVSSVGGLATLEEQVVARVAKGRVGVSPYLLPGMLPNMGAARIAIAHGILGYSSSVATACAAGAQSIGEAVRLLRCGEVDAVVCGGSEAPLFATFADTFGNARALARGWAEPASASRPFDRRRNGLVLAEGAGVLVLERESFARDRGATSHARVLGWSATTDAHHPTTPRPDGTGAAECVRRALRDAEVAASDVDYVNAHGTGTKLGDQAETLALRAVFGDTGPAVSSTKAVTGHMLAASGAVEAAVCVAALRHGAMPPTFNLDDPDPSCELDHIRGTPRRGALDIVLSNTFGFGGHNVSLVFGRVHPPSHD